MDSTIENLINHLEQHLDLLDLRIENRKQEFDGLKHANNTSYAASQRATLAGWIDAACDHSIQLRSTINGLKAAYNESE